MARIPLSSPGPIPPVGTVEFLIHGECPERHWRCAVPGENQRWPRCPLCSAQVMPRRNEDFRRPDPETGGFAYVAVLKPELEALREVRDA